MMTKLLIAGLGMQEILFHSADSAPLLWWKENTRVDERPRQGRQEFQRRHERCGR